MGRDKARLRLGGRSFLSRIRDAARAANLPSRVIRRDLVPRCGPLGGVYTGLQTTRGDAVLFLTCDMPFVTGTHLQQIIGMLSPATDAVFSGVAAVGFPFLIRTRVLPIVAAQLENQDLSIRALARALTISHVPVPDGRGEIAFNVNTLEDYERAQELFRSGLGS